MAHLKTSANNPLRIAELPAGRGVIGITFAPGKHQDDGLTGRHARDLAADLDRVAGWNAAVVVTLVEAEELGALAIEAIGTEVRRRHMAWRHWPIRDYHVPDAAFEAAWPARSAQLRSLLACGGRVLIHCKGGLGRAGTIAARLLVEDGMPPVDAIAAVRVVRPGAIETSAQEHWVTAGRTEPLPAHDTGHDAVRDRAVGALLGLAVGDAIGAALEFSPKPRFAVLDEMVGGGPHELRRGEWTDDTAMALALADSLLHAPELDASDLMQRFVDWQKHGTYSCTGDCFDIGIATQAALARFHRNGDPMAGSTADQSSGNGALMRLSPVAIRHWQNRAEMLRVAALQTRATHGSPATLRATHSFAGMLAEAIGGAALPEVLASPSADIEGGWRGLDRDAIEGSGHVVRSLQAAVWAVARSMDFRSAILLAANLGDDADTTAAIAGQLAGAIYGASGIPEEWLEALAWRDRLEDTAARLFEAGWPEQDGAAGEGPLRDDCVASGTRRDWTLPERLAALAAFAPAFAADGFQATAQVRVARPGVYLGITYAEITNRFVKMAYGYGWVMRSLPWSEWRGTEHGERMMQDPACMACANADDLAHVLTTCIRADRFCDGYLADAFHAGLIARVVARAEMLLREMPPGIESTGLGPRQRPGRADL